MEKWKTLVRNRLEKPVEKYVKKYGKVCEKVELSTSFLEVLDIPQIIPLNLHTVLRKVLHNISTFLYRLGIDLSPYFLDLVAEIKI